MPTTIDYKNLFMNEKGQDIEELVVHTAKAKEICCSEVAAGANTLPDQSYFSIYAPSTYDAVCGKITDCLNRIFDKKTCAGTIVTDNNDNSIFGIVVNPTISNVDLMSILLDPEPMELTRYQVEIDAKVLKVLEPSEIAAYILYNVDCTVSQAAIETVRAHISYILNKYSADIDIKSSINYSNILIFGVKDTIARNFDLICGIHEPLDSFLVLIRNKLNSHLSELSELGREPNMSILDWCLSVYKELKTEYKDAIERLKMAKDITGSRLRKDEMTRLIKSLERASQESLTEAAVRQELMEAKGFSLFKGLKQNGLRSIEEDLYEYKVRAKNCTEQEDAIYILRCVNTRIAILEDYLATTPDLSNSEVDRWRGVIDNYRELRAYISSKKFKSASANFNSFLNIDYDALDKLDGYRGNYYESTLLEADDDTKEEDSTEEKKEDNSSEESTEENTDTDEGFEASDDENAKELSLDDTSSEDDEGESETNNTDQRKDMRQNLSGSDIKSDGGNIYVNCTINNAEK